MPNALTRVTTLLASANYAADATTTGSSVALGFDDGSDRPCTGILFVMDATVVDTAADDTCDVTVDAQVDGTNWMPVVAFTQLVGTGAATRRAIKIANVITA